MLHARFWGDIGEYFIIGAPLTGWVMTKAGFWSVLPNR